MMNSSSDYWEHQRRQKMQQARGADDSQLPHVQGGNQIAFPPDIAPVAPTQPALAAAMMPPMALLPQRPTVPLPPPIDFTDARAVQAAFLRGELDTER